MPPHNPASFRRFETSCIPYWGLFFWRCNYRSLSKQFLMTRTVVFNHYIERSLNKSAIKSQKNSRLSDKQSSTVTPIATSLRQSGDTGASLSQFCGIILSSLNPLHICLHKSISFIPFRSYVCVFFLFLKGHHSNLCFQRAGLILFCTKVVWNWPVQFLPEKKGLDRW